MKREKQYNKHNLVGENIKKEREKQKRSSKEIVQQIQLKGVEINLRSYIKLEKQQRHCTDIELCVIADCLQVSSKKLLQRNLKKR